MASRARTLADGLLGWLDARLVFAHAGTGALPTWPVSAQCLELLREGRVAEAVAMPDNLDARYVVTDHLRPDTRHLLHGHDVALEREVVIKLIRAPSRFAQAAAVHEARVLARLPHPNILEVYEVDVRGAYLVVELLDGDLRESQIGDRALLLDALCQAGRGLAAVHARGFFHGDFKLENIFVKVDRDPSGRPTGVRAKVGDFGNAQPVGSGAGLLEEPPDGSGQLPGPALADQQAFAVAAWEALTAGQLPPNGAELIAPQVRAVLQRALMAEASQRWADMTALVDALERGRAGTAAPKPEFADPRTWVDWAAAEIEAGGYAKVRELWHEAEQQRAGQHLELGNAGLRLGSELARSGRASREDIAQGAIVAVEILLATSRHLRSAGCHERADTAYRLAARATDRLRDAYPLGSRRRRDARRLADMLRAKLLIDEHNPQRKEKMR